MDAWALNGSGLQCSVLRKLLLAAKDTEIGKNFDFALLGTLPDIQMESEYRGRVPLVDYEDIRPEVMRMVHGERNVLWPGPCTSFAQSSGTSGGKSKYIPITRESLAWNHYAGTRDVVAQYLRWFPESRLFDGKAMILGGSFANEIPDLPGGVKVGDLSATLIDSIPKIAEMFRVPKRSTALMSDWSDKLDLLAKEAIRANLTNISGVPSWFLQVLLRAVELTGAENARELWPHMEVFFHGGISFEPYREEYKRLFPDGGMHYFETYNASEGFFATQASRENDGMLLLLDNGVYYEFLPLAQSGGNGRDGNKDIFDGSVAPAVSDASCPKTLGVAELEPGKVYEMIVTAPNGLWRYRIGDTVKVVGVRPLKIRVAGRTKSFINAFGEELMEENAEKGIAAACAATGATVRNYTAGPVYAHGRDKGYHQWALEWGRKPEGGAVAFARELDAALRQVNSDYAAKREGDIFLGLPEVMEVEAGAFERWLASHGNGKLGGQRKIPRLRNDRSVLDELCQ